MGSETTLEESPLESTISAVSDTMQNPQMAVKLLIGLGKGVIGVYTVPFEMVMKPDFGTQYISPITFLASMLTFQFLVFLSLFYKLGVMIYMPKNHGLLGMGTLLICFYVGSVIHIIRVAHWMRNMRLENDSMSDGRGWRVMVEAANGQWVRQRVFMEPVVIIAFAIALYLFHVLDAFASIYIALGGVAYAIKSLTIVYETWLYIRETLDRAYRTRILSDERLQKMMPQQLGGKILAAIPKDSVNPAFIARAMFGLKEKPKAPAAPVNASPAPVNTDSAKPNGYAHLVTPVEKVD